MTEFEGLALAITQLTKRLLYLEAVSDVQMVIIGNALPAAAMHGTTAARIQAGLEVAVESLSKDGRPYYRETVEEQARIYRAALQAGVNTLPPGAR